MKKVITAFCLFISFSSFGQVKPEPKKPNNPPELLTITAPSNLSPTGKAILISKLDIGKIYALPLDKMPCFVADINMITGMPNASVMNQSSTIPNPFRMEGVIPGH